MACHRDICQETKFSESDIEGNRNGFTIYFKSQGDSDTTSVWHLRADSFGEKLDWIRRLTHTRSLISWFSEYRYVRPLGEGGFGRVWQVVSSITQESFAVKIVEVIEPSRREAALAEAKLLQSICRSLNHPNIIQLESFFEVRPPPPFCFP
jgi:serine/threonine protein kinase